MTTHFVETKYKRRYVIKVFDFKIKVGRTKNGSVKEACFAHCFFFLLEDLGELCVQPCKLREKAP